MNRPPIPWSDSTIVYLYSESLRVSHRGPFRIAVLAVLILCGLFTRLPAIQAAEEQPQEEPVHFRVVIAQHVMLLEGRQVITWKDLEGIIVGLHKPELVRPTFYQTRAARDAGKTPTIEDKIGKLRERFKLKGYSWATLSARADWRYDRIKEAADLQSDESLAVSGTILNQDGKPVMNAEAVLVTPVDESISYKEIDISLVQGRLRNPLEDVNTVSDKDGKFTLYPAKGASYYIMALHPDEGFATARSDHFAKKSDMKLLPWAALVGEVREEPGEKQEASLRSTIAETEAWPKLVLTQYWSDLKDKRPTRVFGFTHVPPIIDTTISRDFATDDGGAIGLPGATVGLLPDETRTLNLGPLSKKQREYLKELRRTSRERSERAQIERRQQPFELTVVGPDGKPVPHAEVGVRMRPELNADRVTAGKFTYKQRYGNLVETDDAGRLVLKLPEDVSSLEANIEVPGYGPYVARWSSDSHKNVIPESFKAELEGAWRIGGIVVDEDGKPVQGAEIAPYIEYKKGGDVREQLSTGTTLQTDAEGKWQYASIRESMSDVTVSFAHPDFMPMHISLSRAVYGLDVGSQPSEPIALKRGITLMVKVVDEAGKPIDGALIRTRFTNDDRAATSLTDGMYELKGCRPGMTRIVVSAKGKALELQQVMIEEGLPPLEFVLKPGGHLRVVARDEHDKPIPKARIFFQRWRGHVDYFEFNHINHIADENGVWEWNEAPLDAMEADIRAPEKMGLSYRPLIARAEEYVFRLTPELVISGTVIDAETKQPIKTFRAIPGLRWKGDPSIHWSQDESYKAEDGKYSIRQRREYPAHLVRIEADGYRARVSREIKSDEGSVTIDFAMERAENIEATVLTPDGKPAVGAKVALGIDGSQINIENGDFDDDSTFHAAQLETDEAGKFNFPPQDTDFQLVITHPDGYAHLKATPDSALETIQLLAWAQVKGTFRVGPKLATNVTLEINTDAVNSYGENQPNIGFQHYATTGPDGTFVFERVFAGSGWLGRRMIFMVDDGATEVTSTKRVKFEVAPGEIKQLDVGGDGTPVIGKLFPAKGVKDKVLWSFATVDTQIDLPKLSALPIPPEVQNDPKRRLAWFKEWQLTPEGSAWKAISDANQRLRKTSPYLRASVDRDGTFRIDDVPPGNYVLSGGFDDLRPGGGQLRDYKFTVPDEGEGKLDEPVDLGVLQLE